MSFAPSAPPRRSALGSPPGQLLLRLYGSDGAATVVRLNAAKCSIGSGPGCTLRLRGPGIRPVHCLILRGSAATVVRRWDARTRLDGAAFDVAELRAGSRLGVGPVEIEVLDLAHRPDDGSPPCAARAGASHVVPSDGAPGSPTSIPSTDSNASTTEPRRDEVLRELDETRRELADARRQVDEARRELADARRQLDQARREAAARAEDVETYRRQADARQREDDQRQHQWAQWQREADQRRQSLESDRQTLAAEWKAVEGQRAELDDLRRLLDDRQRELDDARRELDERRARFDAERQAWLDERRRTEQQDASLHDRHEPDEAQQAAATEEYRRRQAELDALGEQIRRRAAELDAQSARLDARSAELDARSAQVEQQAAEVEASRTQVEAGRAELDVRRAEIEAQSATLEARREQIRAEAAALEARRAALDEQVASLEARRAALDDQAASLEARRAELDARSAELAARKNELDAQSARSDARTASLSAREAELETRSAELESRRAQLDAAQGRSPEDSPIQSEDDSPEAPTETRRSDSPVDLASLFERIGVRPPTADEEEEDGGPAGSDGPRASRSDPQTLLGGQTARESVARAAAESHGGDPGHDEADERHEESINDYMARLMDRVRSMAGGSRTAAATSSEPRLPGQWTEPPRAATESDEGRPIARGRKARRASLSDAGAEGEARPRAVAPEKLAGLSAMRELANLSAQAAISTHARKRMVSIRRAKAAVAAVGLLAGVFLLRHWHLHPEHLLALYGGLVGGVVALIWAVQYAVLAGHLYLDRRGRLGLKLRPLGPSQPDASPSPETSAAPTELSPHDSCPVTVPAADEADGASRAPGDGERLRG